MVSSPNPTPGQTAPSDCSDASSITSFSSVEKCCEWTNPLSFAYSMLRFVHQFLEGKTSLNTTGCC